MLSPMKVTGSEGTLVQSVDRALHVLSYLAEHGATSVGDVAGVLGTHKSTASRILATLEKRGFVQQEAERGKYRLGLSVVHLARAVTDDLELVRSARPFCEHLSQEVQETVNISVLNQDEVINIDQVIGPTSIVSVNWMGRRSSLSCTSTGKVLLAFMHGPEQHRLITKPLERCTEHSILKFEVLEKQLTDIRQQGYAYTFEELELGMNAVAAPIWSFTGEVIAALSVSGPSYRMTKERIPELGEAVKRTALEVSEQLGFKPA